MIGRPVSAGIKRDIVFASLTSISETRYTSPEAIGDAIVLTTRFGYVTVTTALVTLAGAAAMYAFENPVSGSDGHS